MAIVVQCECGVSHSFDPRQAGMKTRCRECGRPLSVPPAPQDAETPSAPSVPRQGAFKRPPPRTVEAIVISEPPPSFEPPPPPPTPEARFSGWAAASFALGIPSFCLSFVTGIPAIVLGVFALRQIRRSGGTVTGKGLAACGIVLGAVGTVISPFYLVPTIRSASHSAKSAASEWYLRSWVAALRAHQEQHESWPERLDVLKPLVNGDTGYRNLLQNPTTGDPIGFAYVPPAKSWVGSETAIVILQLRDGRPDPSLMAGFLNNTFRVPTPEEFAEAQRRLGETKKTEGGATSGKDGAAPGGGESTEGAAL